eukprot:scaffold45133_cov30-Tisochrysis_lutea.AAC.3
MAKSNSSTNASTPPAASARYSRASSCSHVGPANPKSQKQQGVEVVFSSPGPHFFQSVTQSPRPEHVAPGMLGARSPKRPEPPSESLLAHCASSTS